MEYAQQIRDGLQARLAEYLDDLRLLTGIDSGPYDRDGSNRVNDWLEARLKRSGFDVQRYPQERTGDNLLARLRGTGRSKIVLLGHSDTVFPPGTAAQRPLTEAGDKILGPGTCDMKAGLLAGIYAVEALKTVGYDGFGELTYLCVSDEELDKRTSIPLIRQTVRGQDAVLTLEAARENGDIVVERKGNLVIWVTAHGRSAHAGVEPEKGRNAIMGLIRRLEAVQSLAWPEHGITINIGVINGGTMPNVVPDEVRVGIDVRAFYQHELEKMAAQITRVFEEPADDDITFTVETEFSSPPMPRTPEIVHLEELAILAAGELEFEVHGASTGGAADAAFAADEDSPALDGLGPIGGLDHSPDEYILKSSIVPRTALLARLIMLISDQ
jgi:glutamate carboxypeptidase